MGGPYQVADCRQERYMVSSRYRNPHPIPIPILILILSIQWPMKPPAAPLDPILLQQLNLNRSGPLVPLD